MSENIRVEIWLRLANDYMNDGMSEMRQARCN